MENPYEPPSERYAPSKLSWWRIAISILTGALSVFSARGIVSNLLTFAGEKAWPDKMWQWFGIVQMLFVMLAVALGLAFISYGVLRCAPRIWKQGLALVSFG